MGHWFWVWWLALMWTWQWRHKRVVTGFLKTIALNAFLYRHKVSLRILATTVLHCTNADFRSSILYLYCTPQYETINYQVLSKWLRKEIHVHNIWYCSKLFDWNETFNLSWFEFLPGYRSQKQLPKLWETMYTCTNKYYSHTSTIKFSVMAGMYMYMYLYDKLNAWHTCACTCIQQFHTTTILLVQIQQIHCSPQKTNTWIGPKKYLQCIVFQGGTCICGGSIFLHYFYFSAHTVQQTIMQAPHSL